MDTGWGMLIMKLLKAVWCTRRRRAGCFNVYQANHRINIWEKGVIRQSSLDRHFNSQFPIGQSSDLSGCCRSPVDRRASPTGSVTSTQSQSQLTPSRQLSDGERLRKVILELVDTERSYVKHLNNLLENYLEPLKNASFLSSAEVTALFGNIREIVAFQRLFLQSIQEALEIEPGFARFEHPHEFKNVLYSVSSAFLYYSNQFKLYSSFCASHSKAQKVLHPSEGNQALQEFLASRNPRQQHSATLESYLIKPIQRILKYPLLLQQLKNLTDPNSDEHHRLVEALKVMEQVAEHINEMQRIHEEYGAIFDHLFRQHQKSCKQPDSPYPQPIDLSPGDLLYYGGVEWLNISDFLGKIKKGLELHAMCFVFKTAVVFLCKERLRQKKKLMGAPGKNSSSEVEIIRYQVLIPVTEVQVRASTMKDMDNHFLWELIHLKSQVQRRSEKVYHLSNSTSEFRNAFLKTIRQIIRESVRNMSIPANKPISSSKVNTNTLQPARSTNAKKKTPSRGQSATLQRHSAGNIDYDNLESYDNVPETHHHLHHHGSSMIVDVGGGGGGSNMTSSLLPSHDQGFRTRSKTLSDGIDELSDSTRSDAGTEFGTRSEGEEEVVDKKQATLGRTPNHLSLSTTSTLSTGSTGSQAKLIQASNQPSLYQPAKSLGGPQLVEEQLKFSTTQPRKTICVDNIMVGHTRSNYSKRMPAPTPRTKYSERGTHSSVMMGDHWNGMLTSTVRTDCRKGSGLYTLPRASHREKCETVYPRSNIYNGERNGVLMSATRTDNKEEPTAYVSAKINHRERLETASLRSSSHGGGVMPSTVRTDYRQRPIVYSSPTVSYGERLETVSLRSNSYNKGNNSTEPLRRDYGELEYPLIARGDCRERLGSSKSSDPRDSHTKWKFVNNHSLSDSEFRKRTEMQDSRIKTPHLVMESYGVLGGEVQGARMQTMTAGGEPAITIDTLLQQLRALS